MMLLPMPGITTGGLRGAAPAALVVAGAGSVREGPAVDVDAEVCIFMVAVVTVHDTDSERLNASVAARRVLARTGRVSFHSNMRTRSASRKKRALHSHCYTMIHALIFQTSLLSKSTL